MIRKYYTELFRSIAPISWANAEIHKIKRRHKEELDKAKNLTQQDKDELDYEKYHEVREIEEFKRAVEDKALIARARKMHVYIEDLNPVQRNEDDSYRNMGDYHYIGDFGDVCLEPSIRKRLSKLTNARIPEYEKWRREYWSLYIQAGGVVIGILGALTGLFAVLGK